MSAEQDQSPIPPSRLEHFPVVLFSSVMGLAGASLAWRRAAALFDGVPAAVGQALFWLAAMVYVTLAIAYVGKWVRHPAAAMAEIRHPLKMAFAPAITISLLLLATAGVGIIDGVGRVLWWAGAVGHLTLTVVVLTAWSSRQDIMDGHITPAWFIPVVGNLVAGLAAKHYGASDMGWFAYGVGLMFWLALLPLVTHRVFVHDQPLHNKLLPSLAIFMAPPAVGMVSWAMLTGDTSGPIPRVLHAMATMYALWLGANALTLRRVPFALPYWAYTFPLAAATVSSLMIADAVGGVGYSALAWTLLALTSVVVVSVSVLTLRAIAVGKVFVPE